MSVSFRPENSDSMVSRTTRLAPTVRIAYPSLTHSPSSDFLEAADAGEGFRELSARGEREQHAETLTARQGQSCHVLHTLVAQTTEIPLFLFAHHPSAGAGILELESSRIKKRACA